MVVSYNNNSASDPKDTILVVDDDRMNLKFAEHMLSSVYNVVMAQSYKEALTYLSKDRPALALLDVHMPDMNGFELLAEIRKIKSCDCLPVVFLTADSDRETEVLLLVAQGCSSKEIADRLHISIHTVNTHRKNITHKTGIKSVAGLAVYAMLHNLIN